MHRLLSLVALGALLSAVPAVEAETPPPPVVPASSDIWDRFFGERLPPEQLERELESFDSTRRSLRDTLRSAIDTLSAVQEYDLAAAEAEAEAIREEIEGVVESLGPEGELGGAANGAYRWMIAQRERIRTRPNLTDPQKALLVAEWNFEIAEVERVLDELRVVEARLIGQLRVASGHEAFLEELLLLGKARVATATLQSVLAEFRRIVTEFDSLGVVYEAPVN